MRICLIGKYPPIQGGVSRDTFWLTYALACQGFDVHVVTNAREVEREYRLVELPRRFVPPAVQNVLDCDHITVHYTAHQAAHHHIPWSNPFVTKLSSRAAEVVCEHDCSLIHSYYLEPYGIAGYLTSRWTGVPFGLRHAGSDIGTLMQSPDLRTTYEHVIRAADYLQVTGSTFRRLLHSGVDVDRLYMAERHSLPTAVFNPGAPPLDADLLSALASGEFADEPHNQPFLRSTARGFDPSLPTIGIYGKAGAAKGSYDLLDALGSLRRAGRDFNFIAATQGNAANTAQFVKRITAYGLAESTWLLPFIPHWLVPSFIRTCSAVCFLERDFPVKIHHPIVPREVLSCGTCLVLSAEIAAKQRYADRLVNRGNVLLVDPRDIPSLAATLDWITLHPEEARDIGQRGYEQVSTYVEDFETYACDVAKMFKSIADDTALRRTTMSLAEMQSCLARLYVDTPFRALFAHAPVDALAHYELTHREKTALQGLDQDMLSLFADSLKVKRRARFEAAYPLLLKILGSAFEHWFDRFYQLYPARPHDTTLDQILAFATFMEESLATAADVPPYTVDIVRYERFMYAAKFRPHDHDSLRLINQEPTASADTMTLDSRIRRADGVEVASFGVDIAQVASSLWETEPVPTGERGEYWYVFQQIPGTLTPKMFAVSPSTANLLAACEREIAARDLVKYMEELLGRQGLAPAVQEILTSLLQLGVIRN